MSSKWRWAVAGFAVAIILLILQIPLWIPIVLILAALAIPLIGYRMLDSNQRKRIRRLRDRGQLGSGR
jgi:hypothetical protein